MARKDCSSDNKLLLFLSTLGVLAARFRVNILQGGSGRLLFEWKGHALMTIVSHFGPEEDRPFDIEESLYCWELTNGNVRPL